MDENEQKQTKQSIFIIKTLLKDLIKQMEHHIIRLVKNLKNLDLENNDRMLQFEKEKYFR